MDGAMQIKIGPWWTYDDIGMVLADATDAAPEPQTKYVEVPGMDGYLDLTECYGYVPYGKREDTYTFVLPAVEDTAAAVWLKRSAVLNEINGLECDYELSWDGGYVRHGRWSVESLDGRDDRMQVVLKVEAQPYRTLGETVFRANAAGGISLVLEGGRKDVQPVVEVYRTTVLSDGERDWTLEPGTWTLDDFWLHHGDNAIAIDTTPEYSVAAMSDYGSDTLESIAGRLMCWLAAGGKPLQSFLALSDIADKKLWNMETQRWIDMTHPASTEDESYNVYFAYERKDL